MSSSEAGLLADRVFRDFSFLEGYELLWRSCWVNEKSWLVIDGGESIWSVVGGMKCSNDSSSCCSGDEGGMPLNLYQYEQY